MRDDRLEAAIRAAGETYEPPWLDVRDVVKRGRRRWWLTRPAVAGVALALVAGTVVTVTGLDLGSVDERTSPERDVAPASALRRWEPIAPAPIAGRTDAVYAWTGSELLVWGGYDPARDEDANFFDGASYDPVTDTWEEMPDAPGPEIGGAASVWTGRELILWGGGDFDGGHERPFYGRAFDPATGRWRSLPKSPYWSLGSHTAVWTGSEMLVWGGVPAGQGSGAAYDPTTDDWTLIPEGPLGIRHSHEAVWTGEEMIVWGGLLQSGANTAEGPDAAAYDPETRTWRTLPDAPLDPVTAAVSFWTGEEVVITGGLGSTTSSAAGAAYDPAADRWRSIAEVPAATERGGAPIPLTDLGTAPAWTGREAVFVTPDGVISYLPGPDRWARASAPREAWRLGATTVWTGDELVVWSGRTWDDDDTTNGGWSARQ